MTEPAWWSTANRGIVGLGPESKDGEIVWPTEGYDSGMTLWHEDYDDPDPLIASGHTQAEWLALADEMIARWTAWRRRIAALTTDQE